MIIKNERYKTEMSESKPSESAQVSYSQEEIDYLSSLHFINNIDHHLRIISSVKLISNATHTAYRVMLMLEIFYNNDKYGNLSFDLRNYEYEDIIEIAQNIRKNEFILQEVDNFLSGDVIE